MQFHQIKYFIAVAETLHFGNAAKKLNMSQPPLSQQIQKLEESLEVKLFNRTKRNVELTEAGSVFLQEAYKIMEQIESSTDKIKQHSNGEIGELILGYSSYSIFDVLPMILDTFYKLYPTVEVKLKHLSTAKQIEAFENSEIQVGLLCPPIDQTNLNLELIYSQPFIVALPSNHPLSRDNKNESLHISELSNCPFILTPRSIGTGYYDSIINLCFDAHFSPKVVQEVNDLHELISLVSTGLGVSIVPESLIQYKKSNVVFKRLNNDQFKVDTALVYKNTETSPVVYNFIDIARRILRDTV
ncbi:LysR family transcriptional regulator [Pseudogracilibacillus auburnensis]|uniref:LysR family transcriptional regulator n=1 Tax=Pseudogracilibacillus auburnensis TaxID=1494959 RepID=A0A2V3WB74_9BACI|nr:LysR family transcriptional regulator [Pseudogracilibacillus auburnensis]MBO1001672.1 LysR family transcriptional regulator [Pseudogracilibacillus auburnensis]PXW89405.1 LysR family transcriptional regulator [Pseudogracilibacillus auburnensis]